MNSKAAAGTILGHPKGLFVLFFTEMWERFSYYGMRALLVLYMTQYLLLDPEKAKTVLGYTALAGFLQSVFGELNVQSMSSQLYGLYTGFVYFTPFFGGILADRILGQRKSVYVGGLLMAIGHFLMASEQMFLLALFFLVLGNGAFKPNISTQVGSLYDDGDPRKDGAYTIFYMGINLGAFFSPLVCGTLGQTYGWHYGFGAAGIGMLVGLIIYHLGRKFLPDDRITQMSKDHVVDKHEKITKDEWSRILALALLCFGCIVFWAIFEQQGNTLQLWADEKTNWTFLGIEVPSTWYQSFNPAFVFMFAPLLNMWWAKDIAQGKASSSVRKMGIGSMLCGLAFVVMILASKAVGEEAGVKGSLLWLAMTTWIFTMGELYLSPIGLSLVSKIAPKRMLSMMMGMWFLSSFFGNYLGGYIGSFYSVMSKDSFFLLLCVMGVVTGLLFMLSEKLITKHIGKV
jgi:POT family proton-dependent oligopeptide transporter